MTDTILDKIKAYKLEEIAARKAKDADGVVTTKVLSTVFSDHADSYAADCKF